MIKKAILTMCIASLFIGVSLIPAGAQTPTIKENIAQELPSLDMFMDDVERLASHSLTFQEFSEKLQELCASRSYLKNPVLREIIVKILQFFAKDRLLNIGGVNIFDIVGRITQRKTTNYFVISYGAYNRLNPFKENSIDLFKERLSMWRYSDAAKLLKGRTIVLERQPFGVRQRLTGPQLGFMQGFRGIYLDIESALTGNAYVAFMGRANRIRAFDLTPLKK